MTDYPTLKKAMEEAFDKKIYDDRKEKMRENLRKWANVHLNENNKFIFENLADKMYKEEFELRRRKEGFLPIHFRYGDRFVMRDSRGRIRRYYKQ